MIKNHFIFLTILSVILMSMVSMNAQDIALTEKSAIQHQPLANNMLSQNIPIIDIRTLREWKATGIIPGSHLITFYEEDSSYDEQKFLSALESIVQKDGMLLILCRSGNRSNKVAHFLFSKGYSHVINLSGGINEAIKNHIQTIPYQSN